MLQGRMNRAMFWLCVVIIVALYVVLNFYFQRRTPVSEVVLVILCVPRLHDIGRSGWLVLAPLALEIGAVIAAFSLLPRDSALPVLGIVTLIIAGLIIWLGCIPGDPASNRFGDPPAPGIKFERPKVRKNPDSEQE
ncbi:DUF805 domain-containing protein [Terricaulis silvestris]|uniref:Putative membrane protein n=1 Tax=Terricaulis silvestris TaxID=2686094 RepID=A0A6I6MID9_9CAUL|nr:DUF805 domain-containing protein [Terricaulis silvestris]QGZ93461.1 putative membrane protein [Terricaulis silvestris]